MYRLLMIVIVGMLLGACSATFPEVRPSQMGFASGGSVLNPLEDGRQHLAAGRAGLAIRRFGEELGRHPRSLEALNGMAVAYARLGRYDVAHTYFERALAIDSREVATLNNYGRSLIEQGRLRDARPLLQQALLYASTEEVPVIAANILSIQQAPPPTVLAAIHQKEEPALAKTCQLIRVAANRYRLQTKMASEEGSKAGREDRRRHASSSAIRNAAVITVEALPPLKAESPDPGTPPVADSAAPAPVRLEPAEPVQVDRTARDELTAIALDDLESIRRVIEARVTSSRFVDLLDQFPETTESDSTAADALGEWT